MIVVLTVSLVGSGSIQFEKVIEVHQGLFFFPFIEIGNDL